MGNEVRLGGEAAKIAEWVSRLVKIPSVNPLHAGPRAGTPGEAALAQSLGGWFEGFGGQVELQTVTEDGRPNVYAIFPGRTDRLVALDVHTDTVTVEHMTDDPFDGRIEGGRVWGRGSVDAKASLGVALTLLERWHAEGLRPEPTFLVVGTISEEGGGGLGAIAFREWAEARGLEIDQLIVSEPTLCAPLYGHKGGAGLEVTVRGESAHSSTPHLGRNAIVAAARAILALEAEHERIQRLPPTSDVGNGTITTALINGGTGGNVVPDRCVFNVGRRVAPFEDAEQIQQDLMRLIEAAVAPCPVEFVPTSCSTGFYQSPDSSLVRDLAAWSATAPTTAPYGTNALKYDRFAREKVVYGPGSIDQAHKAQEWVEIAELAKAAAAFTSWLNPG